LQLKAKDIKLDIKNKELDLKKKITINQNKQKPIL
jgi:hypothetical protein